MVKAENVLLLDTGSANISVAVTRYGPEGVFEIISREDSFSLGVSQGIIKDPSAVAGILKTIIFDKIKIKNVKSINKIYAGFSGAGIKVFDYCSCMQMEQASQVFPGDLRALEIDAGENGVPPGFVVLRVVPQQYCVDGLFVSSPEGKVCTCLEVDYRLIAAREEWVQSIKDVAALCGIQSCEVVYTPLAQAVVLMNGSEMEFGSILVDIGEETTTVTSFKCGRLRNTEVLTTGVKDVATSLAVALHLDISTAYRLIYYWSNTEDSIEVNGTVYSREVINSVIEPVIKEICESVKHTVINFNPACFVPGGIKLAGGGSLLTGVKEELSRCFYSAGTGISIERVEKREGVSTSIAGLASYYARERTANLSRDWRQLNSLFKKLQGAVFSGTCKIRRGSGYR